MNHSLAQNTSKYDAFAINEIQLGILSKEKNY